MELKEFVAICISKAEQADERSNKIEAIRLLSLAKEEIDKMIKKLE